MKQKDLGSQARGRLEELRSAWGLSETTADRLARLVGLLAADPAAPTSVAAPLEALDIHVADSLTALSIEDVSSARSMVDIGSGAGFPGLVLAAALPEAQVDLLESARRKCAFIEQAVSALALSNARAVCARAEQWGAADGAEAYAAATARAVGRLATILEYAAPMLEIGGVLVAWKGRRDRDEEAEAESAAAVLGMSLARVERVEPFAASRNRHLHVYRKQASCPPGYPRRPGMARKRPARRRSRPARRLMVRVGTVQTRNIAQGGENGLVSNQGRHREPEVPTETRTIFAGDVEVDASMSGTVYAIANQKGGVGKTTTAVNMAACIAEAGYETLLVDLDPQCNATAALGLSRDLEPNLYTCLLGDDDLIAAARPTAIDRLRLVPSTPDLAGANVELPRLPGSESRLREAVSGVRSEFGQIVLDCPPALGPLTVNALVAADRVIVPVQAEYLALEGLAQFLDTLSLIQRELNPRLQLAGMLITMHDARTRLAQDVERELREHFPELVFRTVIPRNVRVSEAPSYGRPVIHHDPHCSGADAYFDLAKEVAERG